MPFRAVTTDLQTGHAFAPDRGDLASAVCASMSVPGILSPVFWDGDQLVDGMLVQNLPVETARSLDPQAAVLAVEVGQGLESAYRTSLLGLAFRALDVSIENRTEISRRAADLVLKPNTKAITYLEFHRQVQAAVQEGRAAFDRNLDALEDLLYGPEAALPAPGGVPVVRGPAPLRARAMELAAATLPDGARLNRHYLRWMRRILAEGSARRVDLEFTEAGPVLTLEPYPMLRRVEVTGPEAWTGLCGNLLEDFQVQAGAAYNPVSLGRCLDTLVLRSSLMGRPWLKVERTSFDPDQGVLQVHLREVWPQHFQVQGDRLPGPRRPACTSCCSRWRAGPWTPRLRRRASRWPRSAWAWKNSGWRQTHPIHPVPPSGSLRSRTKGSPWKATWLTRAPGRSTVSWACTRTTCWAPTAGSGSGVAWTASRTRWCWREPGFPPSGPAWAAGCLQPRPSTGSCPSPCGLPTQSRPSSPPWSIGSCRSASSPSMFPPAWAGKTRGWLPRLQPGLEFADPQAEGEDLSASTQIQATDK